MSKSSGNLRTPTLTEALIPVGALVVFLAGSVLNLNELPTLVVITPLLSALASVPLVGGVLYESIPVQIPLAAATVVAAIMAGRLGANWREIQQGMVNGIMHSLGSILILLAPEEYFVISTVLRLGSSSLISFLSSTIRVLDRSSSPPCFLSLLASRPSSSSMPIRRVRAIMASMASR